MPNYSLQVDNRRYDPTDWINIVGENLKAAKEEHKAAQVAYAELQSKAGVFEKLANDVKGKDSIAYQQYKAYADRLRAHTDMLATQGITNATMRNIAQANLDYQRMIHPIEQAYAAREREAQRQAKYLEQHPSAMFEKDAYDMGIDQWMSNPHYIAKSMDLETVANRAKERYAALQKQVMEMVSQSGMTPDAIKRMTPTQVHRYVKQTAPWLYEAMEKRGVSPEEVQRFMSGDKTAIGSILNEVAQETAEMFGMGDWNTDYDHYTLEQNQIRRDNLSRKRLGAILGEATNSIGESKFTPYTDTQSWQYEMAKRRLEWEKEKDAKDREDKAAELAAKIAAQKQKEQQDKINNANMIRIPGVWNDNADNSRDDEIREAMMIMIANGLKDKMVGWDDLENAVGELKKNGLQFDTKKDADNSKYYDELEKRLTTARKTHKDQASKSVSNLERRMTLVEDDINRQIRTLRDGHYLNSDDIQKMAKKSAKEKLDWIIYEKRIVLPILTQLSNDYDRVQNLIDKGNRYIETGISDDAETVTGKISKYLNDAYIKNGYTKDKDGNWIKKGKKARESFFDDVLNFRTSIHEVDFGGTVMDEDVSKDMAERMWSIEKATNELGNSTLGQTESGTSLSMNDKWFDDDADDFAKYLNWGRTGHKYMQLISRPNPTTRKVETYACFWDNKEDAKQEKSPEKAFPVNSRIFGISSSYNNNGNIEYVQDAIGLYQDNMTQQLNDIILNEDATPEEREAAMKALRTNNLEYFAGLNNARMQRAVSADWGRTSGSGVNREHEAAVRGNR